MSLDYSKTGPLGFRALKQNSPFNIKNYQEDMKEPLPDTKGYQ